MYLGVLLFILAATLMFAVFYVSGERVKGLRGSLYVGVLPFM